MNCMQVSLKVSSQNLAARCKVVMIVADSDFVDSDRSQDNWVKASAWPNLYPQFVFNVKVYFTQLMLHSVAIVHTLKFYRSVVN